MRLFVNLTPTSNPYGGANSFVRTLLRELQRRHVETVCDIEDRYDVALINALTGGIGPPKLDAIRSRGIPLIHRKVNYAASGSSDMRARVNGTVAGDRLQLDFEPYVSASVFQSRFSYRTFCAGGYSGTSYSIIHNGVDSTVFGLYEANGKRRSYWDGRERFRFAISTWSKDPMKGFRYFALLDEVLPSLPTISADLVGRVPDGMRFRHIRVHGPKNAEGLGSFLRSCHGYLAFSEFETCSNALLEAINCGLQVIYLDSGSNEELASSHGVRFEGDFRQAVDALLAGYHARLAVVVEHPYDIGPVADRYMDLFDRSLSPAGKG